MAKLSPSQVLNVADLRRIAKRRVPRAVFDYLDGGADAEITLRENCRAFEDIIFRPHQAIAMENCNLRTTVLGQEISFPAIITEKDGKVAAEASFLIRRKDFGISYKLFVNPIKNDVTVYFNIVSH